jgi:hypothetical protein
VLYELTGYYSILLGVGWLTVLEKIIHMMIAPTIDRLMRTTRQNYVHGFWIFLGWLVFFMRVPFMPLHLFYRLFTTRSVPVVPAVNQHRRVFYDSVVDNINIVTSPGRNSVVELNQTHRDTLAHAFEQFAINAIDSDWNSFQARYMQIPHSNPHSFQDKQVFLVTFTNMAFAVERNA